ncbi:Lactonase, 7-bladed beta-propeller-domain-containing protein [Podospora conica]|nr:Lactonase, 7-bladed beta-propeller-domain-containing protein [Schizothecium conicum]
MFRILSAKAFVAALLAAPAAAKLLYATSYNDHAVTVLDLTDGQLTVLDKSLDCGSEPTWLTLDKRHGVLYCLNEGWGGAASITSFKTSKKGKLTTLNVLPVLKSPVASTLFGKNNSGLAVAHYDTSAFTTYNVGKPENLQLYYQTNYTLPAPGPRPDRQEAAHVHDAILDPTGKFIIAPDLGSDALHVFEVGADLSTTPRASIKTAPGAGPRHVAFAKTASGTYLYSFNELSNTVSGFKVEYSGSELTATPLFDVATRPAGDAIPAGTKAAEIEVSPDQKFVIVSSRGENNLQIPAFAAGGAPAGARIVSDPLVSFSIDQATGALAIVQRAPAGGRNPRGFSINKAGTLVASALQDDNRVVVYARDVATGLLGEAVAWATVGEGENNGPNYVIFDE